MYKHVAMIGAAVAILSLGSLMAAQAGGGATSAPSKYNNAAKHYYGHPQAANYYAITEFSSSSARSAPKR
jgi:hypothetical protein